MRIKNAKVLFLAAVMAVSMISMAGCDSHEDDPNSVGRRSTLSSMDESSIPDTQSVSVYKFSILTDDRFKDKELGELMTDGTMTDADLAKLRENGIEFIGYINIGGETVIVDDTDENGKPFNNFTIAKTNTDGSMILNLGTESAPKYIAVHKNSLGELVVDLDKNNAIIGDEIATGQLNKRNKDSGNRESEEKSDDSSDSDLSTEADIN